MRMSRALDHGAAHALRRGSAERLRDGNLGAGLVVLPEAEALAVQVEKVLQGCLDRGEIGMVAGG